MFANYLEEKKKIQWNYKKFVSTISVRFSIIFMHLFTTIQFLEHVQYWVHPNPL